MVYEGREIGEYEQLSDLALWDIMWVEGCVGERMD
jgi:hypothetical protein